MLSYAILTGTIIAQVVIIFLSTQVALFPDHDALIGFVSTFSEVVAGLYGIVVAGYTFFLSRIDGLTAEDYTLDVVAGSVKKWFKYLIWFITFYVLMTLLTSAALMYLPALELETYQFYYRLFCNEFVGGLIGTMILIMVYSLLVIDPRCLEKEADRLKKKLEGKHATEGDVAQFMELFGQIRTRCINRLPEVVAGQLREVQFLRAVDLLQNGTQEREKLISDIKLLYRYHSCIINGTRLSASKEMCSLARDTLRQLQGKKN